MALSETLQKIADRAKRLWGLATSTEIPCDTLNRILRDAIDFVEEIDHYTGIATVDASKDKNVYMFTITGTPSAYQQWLYTYKCMEFLASSEEGKAILSGATGTRFKRGPDELDLTGHGRLALDIIKEYRKKYNAMLRKAKDKQRTLDRSGVIDLYQVSDSDFIKVN